MALSWIFSSFTFKAAENFPNRFVSCQKSRKQNGKERKLNCDDLISELFTNQHRFRKKSVKLLSAVAKSLFVFYNLFIQHVLHRKY